MDAFSLINYKEIKIEDESSSNNYSDRNKVVTHFQEIKQEAEVNFVCELPEEVDRCGQNTNEIVRELLSNNENAKQSIEKRTKAKCKQIITFMTI